MSEKRQPQPEQGVTGYAAHPRRFDTAAPWAPAPAVPAAAPVSLPAEPDPEPIDPYAGLGTILGVAAVPPHVADIVPAEVYDLHPPGKCRSALDRTAVLPEPAFLARIPTSVPVPASSPVPVLRPRPARRRLRAAVATVVALAGLGAVGVGYVAFTHTTRSSPQAKAQVIPEMPPIDGTLPGGVSGADPIAPLPTSPPVAATVSAPTTRAATASGAPTANVTQPAPRKGGTVTASPADPEQAEAAPLRLLAPAATTAGTLEATFSYSATKGDNGISRYQGTIEIDSTQPSDVASWQLTLTVPGGNPVAPNGPVVVSQDGEQVQFAPGDGGAVPAGGSLTFTFTVSGVLSDLPANCLINGESCH